MPIVYVIHASEDARFVDQQLVAALPVLGFDQWVSARHLAGSAVTQAQAMAASGVVLAVVSAWAARATSVRNELEQAANAACQVVPVAIDHTPLAEVSKVLESLAAVDLRRDSAQPLTAERIAVALRPRLALTAGGPPDASIDARAAMVPWDPKVFSALLARAVAQHDQSHSDELVTRLASRVQRTGAAYDVQQARQDLGTLRRQRQFPLMQKYVLAVRASGVDDPNVMRQYAQALIELGQFDDAIGVLHSVLERTDSRHSEAYEARGLLGRAYKQMYVNAPGAAAAPLLMTAIAYYYDAYREDQQLVWHGINAATCIRRAERDLGLQLVESPQRIGQDILQTLSRRGEEKARKNETLEAFDLATRVEALVVVGDIEKANRALTDYLQHPDAHAFEVSSTHRQFEQVLQLQGQGDGSGLVDRLWEAVQRHRAPLALRASDTGARVSALVSVTDPNWTPAVTGAEVSARLGTIVAIDCDPAAIKGLLSDPMVLGVSESRRTNDTRECKRSVPFVGVPELHTFAAGAFQERGANALVAVIDDGIDVLHEAFLDAGGKSRIVGVWDQRDRSGTPPPGFKIGTYHDAGAIAGYIEKQEVPEALGRDPDGHGTHVASIAVGRAAGDFAGGVAPEAQLLFVIADPRDPIGYSTEHVAALNFISQEADRLGKPVVVNVSQGMNAGAHDGRSLLEKGFENFSDFGSKPGRVIVKSAGNAGSANGHAAIQLTAGSTEEVSWRRAKDPNWEYDRLEFWWNSGDTYRFTLVAPSGEESQPADIRQPTVGGLFGDCNYRLQLVRRHQFNGDSQLLVEVGSDDTNNEGRVPPGDWTLRITHVDGPGNVQMDGWIERGPVPASAFQPPHVSPRGSLSVPGTARNVITVGAINVAKDDKITATKFTSLGPTRDGRNKPDVSAPGANVLAAKSGTSSGAFADDGTSMAAPFVAGAVALLLSRTVATGEPWPTSAQVCPVLRQKTRIRNVAWHPAQGFGVVDVAALLAAFD